MGETFCGSDCSTDGVCPAGYECVGVGDGAGRLVAQQCAPVSGTCSAPPPVDAGPPDQDAGPPPMDASVEEDAAPEPIDLGPPDEDAG